MNISQMSETIINVPGAVELTFDQMIVPAPEGTVKPMLKLTGMRMTGLEPTGIMFYVILQKEITGRKRDGYYPS